MGASTGLGKAPEYTIGDPLELRELRFTGNWDTVETFVGPKLWGPSPFSGITGVFKNRGIWGSQK